MKKLFRMIFISFVLISGQLLADELVYTPINPSFGGSPLNGSWMLSQAISQNRFTESNNNVLTQRNNLDDFSETLNRQILSRLSRDLVNDIFGEGSLEEGRFEFGNLILDVVAGPDGLNINIFDLDTGGETSILIPYF